MMSLLSYGITLNYCFCYVDMVSLLSCGNTLNYSFCYVMSLLSCGNTLNYSSCYVDVMSLWTLHYFCRSHVVWQNKRWSLQSIFWRYGNFCSDNMLRPYSDSVLQCYILMNKSHSSNIHQYSVNLICITWAL